MRSCHATKCNYCRDKKCHVPPNTGDGINANGQCIYYYTMYLCDYSQLLLPEKYKDKRTEREKILDEIIDFFELEEGYDKDELITNFLDGLLKPQKINSDEVQLIFGDNRYFTELDSFAKDYYDLVIQGVCNVLKSFKEDN
jgi:hypothetical protein